MKKVLTLVLALVFVLGLSAGAYAEGKNLKIVYCGTSLSSESGDRFVQLAKVIEQEVNAAGGVNGAQLEFVMIDGGSDQQAYIDALLKALEVDDVSAIIGTFFSQYALACVDYVNDEKIPVFNIATNFEMREKSDYYFTNRCVDTAFSATMAQIALDHGVKNPVTLCYNTSNGQNDTRFMKEYMEANGCGVAESIFFDNTTTTDYTPIVQKAMNVEGSDGILLHATANTDGQSIIAALHQYGYQYPIISNSNLFSDSFIVNTGAENCIGMIGFAEFSTTLDRQQVRDFEKLCSESELFTYDTISWIDASFYDDAHLIIEAARIAGSNDVNAIYEGLQKIDNYEGVMTSYSFHEDHSYANFIYLTEIVAADNNIGASILISEPVAVAH